MGLRLRFIGGIRWFRCCQMFILSLCESIMGVVCVRVVDEQCTSAYTKGVFGLKV